MFFWVWTYSGYSGDLSPKLTLEFLTGKENNVLIDVRPEASNCKFFWHFFGAKNNNKSVFPSRGEISQITKCFACNISTSLLFFFKICCSNSLLYPTRYAVMTSWFPFRFSIKENFSSTLWSSFVLGCLSFK